MVFGRRKKNSENTRPQPGADGSEAGAAEQPAEVEGLRSNGPFDSDEAAGLDGYLDLGALRLMPREGLQLRLEVEESTQRVVAVTLDFGGSSLQLQAFAAPKSEGLWEEIRNQIASSVSSEGGTVEELEGALGTEVVAKLPVQMPDGQRGYRVARFLGVDGPRWFLRGVIGGPAALDREQAAALEEMFRSTVVVRGDAPMPPRDLLTLRLPKDATREGPAVPAPGPGLTAPERGPEITEIG
ncbi:DUF3710 domain-containing protein [Arthrobacter sp. I2-34]|uniref:DUF3710 domain-containing protein n=1 Tax=Arthrobacter hankyongi TaxID=2904801 RepID=A0ABS9LBW8_9MICC|nr:DUF3710 domain-containing protein [Arthrobacter hankyongi]MCG2624173.1 DUF3710 domain-containing protein [Arthrobacter hankyongi]